METGGGGGCPTGCYCRGACEDDKKATEEEKKRQQAEREAEERRKREEQERIKTHGEEAAEGVQRTEEKLRKLSDSSREITGKMKSWDAEDESTPIESETPQLMGGFVCDSASAAEEPRVPAIRRVPKAKKEVGEQTQNGSWVDKGLVKLADMKPSESGTEFEGHLLTLGGKSLAYWNKVPGHDEVFGKLGEGGLENAGKLAKITGAGAEGAGQAADAKGIKVAQATFAYQESERAKGSELRKELADGAISEEEYHRRFAALATDAESRRQKLTDTWAVAKEAAMSPQARDAAQKQAEKDYSLAKGVFGWLDGSRTSVANVYESDLKHQKAAKENRERWMKRVRELRAAGKKKEADELEQDIKQGIKKENEITGFGTGTSAWGVGIRAATSEGAVGGAMEGVKKEGEDRVKDYAADTIGGALGDSMAARGLGKDRIDSVITEGKTPNLVREEFREEGAAGAKVLVEAADTAEDLKLEHERPAEQASDPMENGVFFPDCSALKRRP